MPRFGAAALLLLASVVPAAAQQPGWGYSPLPGEGDRAALGCAPGSDAAKFVCLAVRCEDDFTVSVQLHASPPDPASGVWTLTIDEETAEFDAVPSSGPYRARLTGDMAWLLDRLKHGGVLYLHSDEHPALPLNGISLSGSLYAINRALAWCAPRLPVAPDVQAGGTPPS